VSAIADIILREVLGVNTTFICTWGSVHAMKLLGGCKNPMDGSQPCVVDGVPQLPVPLAHVSVESWVTTPTEVDEMNTYNTNLGMLGYYSKSGLYFDKNIAVTAFENENLSLEWWQNFADHPTVNKYFDSYSDVAADIAVSSGHKVAPKCKDKDGGFLALQQLGFNCSDGWFFSPACEADKSSCIPVILAEYDWNGLVWIQAIVQHRYRFAITWLGAAHSLSYSMRTSKRLLFYCATTSALCYEKPIVKMFADTHMPAGRPDLITSLLKVVWKQLPKIDKRVFDLVTQMYFSTPDLEAVMAAYSEKIKPGQMDSNPDDFVPEIACKWLRNQLRVNNNAGTFTGRNTAKWMKWIPRKCQEGEAYDKAAGACRSCKVGEYSVDGWQCNACSPGTFSAVTGAKRCQLCDVGKWQRNIGETACVACPSGSQRSSSDQDCRKCDKGYFANNTGQEACKRCPAGSWMDKVGSSSDCNQCLSTLTTPSEAAISADECVCLPGTFWSLDSHQCTPCPEGMTCDGGMATLNQTTLHRQPLINQKHYADEDAPYEAFQCFSAGDLCLGGSQFGHNQCGGGRHGLQCNACAPGWRGRKGEPCVDCRESGEYSWLPICFVLAFVGLGAVYTVASGKKNSSSSKTAMIGTLSICAVNAQMFSITVSMSVGWSNQFMSYYGWMDIFEFNIDGVSALSCYLGKESMQPNYLPGLLLPILLAGMMMMLWGVSRLLAKCVRRITPMKLA